MLRTIFTHDDRRILLCEGPSALFVHHREHLNQRLIDQLGTALDVILRGRWIGWSVNRKGHRVTPFVKARI